jgi:hypothetical protein
MAGNLHEDLFTFMIVYLRNVSDESCRENKKTYFMFSTFLYENPAGGKMVGVRQVTDDNVIRRMRFACWITKATNTYSEYVIRIPFPRQQ